MNMHRKSASSSKAAREVGIDASVAEDYTKLLEAVFLIHRLPAWGTTLRSRVASHPKVHMTDPGLGGHLLGLTPERLASKEPAALTEFGHLSETFVVGEILKQASWSEEEVRFGQFRTYGGAEVDLVAETPHGRIAGVEVKASSRVAARDLTGLRMLREKAGDRFIGGVVLCFGPRAYTFEDRIHVVPIDRLWS